MFLRRWDPIGVYQVDDPALHAPEDEYDGLVPGLYRHLREGDDQQEVFEYLTHELSHRWEIEPRPEIDRAFAAELGQLVEDEGFIGIREDVSFEPGGTGGRLRAEGSITARPR